MVQRKHGRFRSAKSVTMKTCMICLLTSLCAVAQANGAKVCQALRINPSAQSVLGIPDTPSSAVLDTFTSGETGQSAVVQTRAVVEYDKANLYLRVECLEPNMAGLLAKCGEHDGQVFADDCVEVFISPKPSGAPYFHFAANSRGTPYEEKGRGDSGWNAAWTVKGTVEKDRWSLDITIPFAALGVTPQHEALWRLNVDRQRQAGGKLELSSWAPTRANFHDVHSFGYLVFDDDYTSCLRQNVLTPWKARATKLAERLKAEPGLPGGFEERLEELEQSLQPVREAVDKGSVSRERFELLLSVANGTTEALGMLMGDVDTALQSVEVAAAMRRLARPGQRFLAYVVRPITNAKILPVPAVPRSAFRQLSVTACRGEYEPASFVLYPFEDLTHLTVTVSDLRGRAGSIPASAVDVRSVKCWYQSGEGGMFPINQKKRVLTPELLLKDDSLVRVDPETKENYLKLVFPSGEVKWRWISNPKPTPEESNWSAAACPVRDATTMQPVAIPKETAKQYWLTVHVPAKAPSGIYRGRVELRTPAGIAGSLPIRLEVLPFDLEPDHLESSVYFHWGDHQVSDAQASAIYNRRSAEQFRREFENLLAHGVDNPTVGGSLTGSLRSELAMRQQTGMSNRILYHLTIGAGTPPERLKEVLGVAGEFGFEKVYFYGRDEASGDALKAQREEWERVHSLGGKLFVAGYAGDNFKLMGDLQDLLVCAGRPSREEAARWHNKGNKIFCYAHPQSGIEEPETYRRNFGLLLDRNDYDGGMTYIYYHDWNDFNEATLPYRCHNFVYPTVDGVIDTIQWEGYREGIDDLRYLTTLRKAVAEAESAGIGKEAAAAKRFIDGMEVTGDLDALRREMVAWIRRLRCKVVGRVE